MGVRGLTTLVERSNCTMSLPKNSKVNLVIDGDGLKHFLFEVDSANIDTCYNTVYRKVKDYFGALAHCGLYVRCIFFDCHTLLDKRNEIVIRAKEKYNRTLKKWETIKSGENPKFKFYTISIYLSKLFQQVIYDYCHSKYDIELHYSCNDCDKEIASYSLKYNAYILGKDSDFYIFPNAGYIPFPKLEFLNNNKDNLQVYTNVSVAKGLNISVSSLTLLAAIAGNDFFTFPWIFYEVKPNLNDIMNAIQRYGDNAERVLQSLCNTQTIRQPQLNSVKEARAMYCFDDYNSNPSEYIRTDLCVNTQQRNEFNTLIKKKQNLDIINHFFDGSYNSAFVSLLFDASINLQLPRVYTNDDKRGIYLTTFIVNTLARFMLNYGKDSKSEYVIIHPLEKLYSIQLQNGNSPLPILEHVIRNYNEDVSTIYSELIDLCLPNERGYEFKTDIIKQFFEKYISVFEIIDPIYILCLFIIKMYLNIPKPLFISILYSCITKHDQHVPTDLPLQKDLDILRFVEYYKYTVGRICIIENFLIDETKYMRNSEVRQCICFGYIKNISCVNNVITKAKGFKELYIVDCDVDTFIKDVLACVY